MPGLTIGGVTVPALARNAKGRPVNVEDWDKAFDGTPRGVIRSSKRSWELQLVPKAQTLAYAFAQLLKGEGHAWSFDSDLASSRGLWPNAGHSATIVASGRYGSRMHVPTGTSITYGANLGSNWTLAVWRLENAAWNHYIITSGGHKWQNGFRQDGLNTIWLGVSSGSVTISGTTAVTTNEDFDDLRALPYVIDDSWGSQIYAEDGVRAISALPILSAGGSLIVNGPVNARGRVNDSDIIRTANGGILESPSFVLLES
jgi:hypothetical protein